jgi:hypothetical protein
VLPPPRVAAILPARFDAITTAKLIIAFSFVYISDVKQAIYEETQEQATALSFVYISDVKQAIYEETQEQATVLLLAHVVVRVRESERSSQEKKKKNR